MSKIRGLREYRAVGFYGYRTALVGKHIIDISYGGDTYEDKIIEDQIDTWFKEVNQHRDNHVVFELENCLDPRVKLYALVSDWTIALGLELIRGGW